MSTELALKINKITEQHQQNLTDVKALLSIGKPISDIARLLNLNKKTVYRIKKIVEYQDVNMGNLPKLARKALEEKVKEGNVSAIKMVLDRTQPIVTKSELTYKGKAQDKAGSGVDWGEYIEGEVVNDVDKEIADNDKSVKLLTNVSHAKGAD